MVRAAGLEPRALTTVLLLGRDPQPRPNDVVETQFLRVADSAMSKTHVAIGPSPDGVWVQDRNSSNGTEAILPSGPRPLEPDVPTVLSLPCAVRAGDTTIEIAWGAG